MDAHHPLHAVHECGSRASLVAFVAAAGGVSPSRGSAATPSKPPSQPSQPSQQPSQPQKQPSQPSQPQPPPRPDDPDLLAAYQSVLAVGEECQEPDELLALMRAKRATGFRLYDGFEPSGRTHGAPAPRAPASRHDSPRTHQSRRASSRPST